MLLLELSLACSEWNKPLTVVFDDDTGHTDEVDADTDTDTDADSDADGDSDTDSDADSDSDSDSDSDTDADTDTGPPVDADGDGYAADVDCDDADALVHPGAEEVCDYVDNNCVDGVDEGVITTWFADSDGDGYGDVNFGFLACEQPADYVADATDCDDGDAMIHPGAEETCTDPTDYNCDGSVGYADADADGTVACEDCDDASADVYPGADEVCNSVDDDCDGATDDADTDVVDPYTWYADADGDEYGDETVTTRACLQPAGYVNSDKLDDCDDTNASVSPGEPEVCNGVDDDCSGIVDDSLTVTWYADTDGDGYGNLADTVLACAAPAGYVADSTDCNDANASANPGEAEVCDGVDNNCVAGVDEGVASVLYQDADGDTYGNGAVVIMDCAPSPGVVVDSTDCDDGDGYVNPSATEVCDGVDNDCSGVVDDVTTAVLTWYEDGDADGYGNPASSVESCSAPAGYVADSTDCDDVDEEAYPGALENIFTTEVDEDCDGEPLLGESVTVNGVVYDIDSANLLSNGDFALGTSEWDRLTNPAGLTIADANIVTTTFSTAFSGNAEAIEFYATGGVGDTWEWCYTNSSPGVSGGLAVGDMVVLIASINNPGSSSPAFPMYLGDSSLSHTTWSQAATTDSAPAGGDDGWAGVVASAAGTEIISCMSPNNAVYVTNYAVAFAHPR